MRRISILILGLTLSAAMLSAKAKYVFYFIGDGMGINQVLLTEMYRSARGEAALSFTSFPAVTYATTFATNDGKSYLASLSREHQYLVGTSALRAEALRVANGVSGLAEKRLCRNNLGSVLVLFVLADTAASVELECACNHIKSNLVFVASVSLVAGE